MQLLRFDSICARENESALELRLEQSKTEDGVYEWGLWLRATSENVVRSR